MKKKLFLLFLIFLTISCILIQDGTTDIDSSIDGEIIGYSIATTQEPTRLPENTETPEPTSIPMVSLKTKINNIAEFLEKCPTNDPIFPKLLEDFKVRFNDEIRDDIYCTEPISDMHIKDYNSYLIAYQVMRTAYYMDPEIPGHLPWTEMSLYDWMVSNVDGINFRSDTNVYNCCDRIDDKLYISAPVKNRIGREYARTWIGISTALDVYAHEIRHADGGPGHVLGCEAFPPEAGIYGCDANYDLDNLGSYGVQYWLHQSWATGYLNIGISCSPEAAKYISAHIFSLNSHRQRFRRNAPEPMGWPEEPYGGPCHAD